MSTSTNFALRSDYTSLRTNAAPSGGIAWDATANGGTAEVVFGTASTTDDSLMGHIIPNGETKRLTLAQGEFAFARNRKRQNSGTLVLTEVG